MTPPKLPAIVCTALFAVFTGTLPPTCPAQEASEPEEKTPAIQGQVFNFMGAGVQGVEVTVRRAGSDASDEPAGSTRTDDMGDFAVQLPGAKSGKYVVQFSAPGYGDASREVELDVSAEYPPFVDVELLGNEQVTGVVRDARNEKPIKDAKVTLQSMFRDWSDETDEAGRFEIPGLLPGQVTLTASADGFGREHAPIEVGTASVTVIRHPGVPAPAGVAEDAEAKGLVIKLKPERVVKLRVVDPEGQPVAGAMLEGLDDARDDYRTLVTDAKGEATLDGLNFDTRNLSLRIQHDRYVSSTEFDRTIELPEEPTKSSHTLRLQAAGSLAGVVTDASTGEALNGARVMVGRESGSRLPREWTDFEGEYHINGVPPGEQVVTVHLVEHAPQLHKIHIEPGKTARLSVKMEPAAAVEGVVTDAEGNPLSGVHVRASEWKGFDTLGLQAMTDAKGGFQLRNAPRDSFRVTLRHPQFAPLEDQLIDAGKSENRFQFTETADSTQAMATKLTAGDDAPDVKLTTLEGDPVRISDLRGKIVLLDFWATWCGPCLAEMPGMKKLHAAFAKRDDFVMIGISLDDDERGLENFAYDKGLRWPQVVGKKAGAAAAADAYGVTFIPATFLIDKAGKVKAVNLRSDALKPEIEKLLD